MNGWYGAADSGSVYRSVVEERLKAQVRCLEVVGKTLGLCAWSEVDEPILYQLRKPAVSDLLKLSRYAISQIQGQ